jgi:hypothetical protein
VFGFAVLSLFGGVPGRPMIRGGSAQAWDKILLMILIFGSSFLLFYVLDAVRLSAALLQELSQGTTIWPETTLARTASRYGVEARDVAGYLDVQFAARKTQSTAFLLFLPFLVQFFMLLSRNSYWEWWLWQGNLVFIMSCNIVLALSAWFWLRSAARDVRVESLQDLEERLFRLKSRLPVGPIYTSDTAAYYKNQPAASQAEPDTVTPEQRQLGLARLKSKIESDNRGAYANLVQDPALLAVLIPTGLLGIITVVVQVLFGRF